MAHEQRREGVRAISDHEAAWDELHAAKPPGWWVGSPSYHPERQKWLLYAFDPSERAKAGLRSRAWEVEGPTEEYVVREMARCLREIKVGRVPK